MLFNLLRKKNAYRYFKHIPKLYDENYYISKYLVDHIELNLTSSKFDDIKLLFFYFVFTPLLSSTSFFFFFFPLDCSKEQSKFFFPIETCWSTSSFFVCEVCIARFKLLETSFNLAFADCSFAKKFDEIAKWLCCIPTFIEVVEQNMANMDISLTEKRGLFLWKKIKQNANF